LSAFCISLRQQDAKFITADAGNNIFGPAALFENLGGFQQKPSPSA
jgi:hypothetical protein